MTVSTQTSSLIVALVERVNSSVVEVLLPDGTRQSGIRLRSSGGLRPGDRVLMDSATGVVVGALDDGSPDDVVIEAGRALTIRCGAGSIQIRHDGRILIDGLDVVSRAARTNRVSGSQVVVN